MHCLHKDEKGGLRSKPWVREEMLLLAAQKNRLKRGQTEKDKCGLTLFYLRNCENDLTSTQTSRIPIPKRKQRKATSVRKKKSMKDSILTDVHEHRNE